MTLLGHLPPRVTVYEVGPRDGLQNEPQNIPTDAKVEYINRLSKARFPWIEVTSFVRSGAIPQLADAERVTAGIERHDGVRYSALVPNSRGMERAETAGLDGVALFTAASETFSRRNTNATIAETLERFRPVEQRARSLDLWVRAYVSTAFGCPYEGAVSLESVQRVSVALLELGADQIVLSDTIGVATPAQVETVVEAVAGDVPLDRIGLHFHDTRGTALANVLAGLQLGITTFDSASGGLGGCPYAPGAAGNLATEDLLYMLHGLGIETGIDLNAVVEASRFLATVRGAPPVSRYFQAATA